VALFQPSEESHPLGAEMIVERGMLPPARAVLAVHVHPELPWRSVIAPAGPVNASCDFITLTIHGIGGHAAYPHRTRDPVLALSATIVAAQQLISRRTDPLRPAVIALTCLEAGTVENIVPDIAQARGTLRALEPSDRHRLASELQDLVHGIAAAHGCRAELEVRLGEPTLVNDARLAEAVKPRLEAFGFTTDGDFRSCGSDDFSFYGSVAPTLMLFAGLDGSPGFQPRALHDAAFLPPDAAVEVVAQSYLAAYLSVWASIT
jgi:amidohydrolase